MQTTLDKPHLRKTSPNHQMATLALQRGGNAGRKPETHPTRGVARAIMVGAVGTTIEKLVRPIENDLLNLMMI